MRQEGVNFLEQYERMNAREKSRIQRLFEASEEELVVEATNATFDRPYAQMIMQQRSINAIRDLKDELVNSRRWSTYLTITLIVLTAVIAWFTVILTVKHA